METWRFKYDPDIKRQSAQWKPKGEVKPQKRALNRALVENQENADYFV